MAGWLIANLNPLRRRHDDDDDDETLAAKLWTVMAFFTS